MELYLQNTGIGTASVLIILIVISIIVRAFMPKKKLCQKCDKIKTHKDKKSIICDDCIYDELLQEATKDKKILLCPHDGTEMTKKLIKEIKNVVIDVCPKCETVVLPKEKLKKITFLAMDLHPEK